MSDIWWFTIHVFYLSHPGDISIEALEKLIQTCFDGSQAEFSVELKEMLEKNIYNQRKRQIDICYNLKHYHKGAKVIMELKDIFELTGDFTDLQKILQSV